MTTLRSTVRARILAVAALVLLSGCAGGAVEGDALTEGTSHVVCHAKQIGATASFGEWLHNGTDKTIELRDVSLVEPDGLTKVGSAVAEEERAYIGSAMGWPPQSENWPENPPSVTGFELAPGAEVYLVVGVELDDETKPGSFAALRIDYVDAGGAEFYQQRNGGFGMGAAGEDAKKWCRSFADK